MKHLIHKIKKTAGGRGLLLLACLFFFSTGSFSQDEGREQNIKAMFVLNFMKYIEWPPEAAGNVFKIGVSGDKKLYSALLEMTKNRQERKKIKIEMADFDSPSRYHILLLSGSESRRSEEWTKKFPGKGVLIISDDCKSNCFAAINLISINSKIRFEINSTQAKQSGIKISSRLTDLAVSVHP